MRVLEEVAGAPQDNFPYGDRSTQSDAEAAAPCGAAAYELPLHITQQPCSRRRPPAQRWEESRRGVARMIGGIRISATSVWRPMAISEALWIAKHCIGKTVLGYDPRRIHASTIAAFWASVETIPSTAAVASMCRLARPVAAGNVGTWSPR